MIQIKANLNCIYILILRSFYSLLVSFFFLQKCDLIVTKLCFIVVSLPKNVGFVGYFTSNYV